MFKKLKKMLGGKKKKNKKGGSSGPSGELQGGLGNAFVQDSMGQKQKAEGLGMGFSANMLGKASEQNGPARPMLTDADVKKRKGGPDVSSINEVHRIKYDQELGDSGSNMGYFKASSTNKTDAGAARAGISGHMAARAVASSRLDEALGTNILSREYFAEHDGEVGSVSAQGKGTELANHLFEARTTAAYYAEKDGLKTKDIGSERFAREGYDSKDFGGDSKGRLASRSGMRFNYTDVRNADFQRGMADLAVMDYLTGQVDRHLQNILADENGQVTGIDNDQAFGLNDDQYENPELNGASKNVGMPTLLDANTARSLIDMTPEQFLATIGGSELDPEQLTEEEKAGALERFKKLQEQALEQDLLGETVTEWNDESFDRAMEAESGSYLARYATGLEDARWYDEVKGVNDDKKGRKERAGLWDEARAIKDSDDFQASKAFGAQYLGKNAKRLNS